MRLSREGRTTFGKRQVTEFDGQNSVNQTKAEQVNPDVMIGKSFTNGLIVAARLESLDMDIVMDTGNRNTVVHVWTG